MTIECQHYLLNGEISTGRLAIARTRAANAQTWLSNNERKSVAVFMNGKMLNRSAKIEPHKGTAWRIACGQDSFRHLKEADSIHLHFGENRIDISVVDTSTVPTAVQLSQGPETTYVANSGQQNSPQAVVRRPVLGARISFRGLEYGPTNESGVVCLFGMVFKELGFLLEVIQPGFPDCRAKHQVSKHPNERWQDVRIEFEFKSSNFVSHRHDISQCDMIVCWEHDWLECPLKVIELRKEIQNLPK